MKKKGPRPPASEFARTLDEARALLRDAADRWARGDAEDPTTLDVLLTILEVFARDRFLLFPTEARPDPAE